MYSFIAASKDKKLGGNMPATYSPLSDCNPHCIHYVLETCYGLWGHVAIHWRKISADERGITWAELLQFIRGIPHSVLWRHNIAGDLPRRKRSHKMSRKKCMALVKAARRSKPFTYCHHEKTARNIGIMRRMNAEGFTVNMSTDTMREAAHWFHAVPDLPIVTLLPLSSPKVQEVDGVKIIKCPAEYSDVGCGPICAHTMCANPNRDWVIGFTAHSTKAKQADIIARG